MPDSTLNNTFHEQTHGPLYADCRDFYKVEKWSRDGMRVELMLYAGDDIDKDPRLWTPADSGAGPLVPSSSRF
jgi:hypothetical protein